MSVVTAPALDGRRFASLLRELLRHAPHYVPDLDLAEQEGVGPALMRIGAHLGEAVAARLDRAPDKNLVAFLDRLGVTLLPARPARVAVTFKLASGLQEAVLVPGGARVTAPGDDEDIPFETTDELLAIPGALAATYGVDPARDAIYIPPPRFLEQEPRAPSELRYEVVTFAAAGATRLQLSHVDALEERSVLRIGCRERVVVAAVENGNIVKLATPLEREAAAGTLAVAIRDFQVFDGIDVQEHVLYVGHADLLTVKEKADIVLRVGLAEGPLAALGPLALAWEFWTKDEKAPPGDQEQWRALRVRLDGTGGLVRSGEIALEKPADLEIQEREVGGRKNRWIRAVLRDKIPPGGRALPEIDSLEIGVTSDGAEKPPTELAAGIEADQGFHNATPLNVKVGANVGFFPFGTEPRQFDSFYLASKEAFSKREAEARLNFDLDLQTLAAPAAVLDERRRARLLDRAASQAVRAGAGRGSRLADPRHSLRLPAGGGLGARRHRRRGWRGDLRPRRSRGRPGLGGPSPDLGALPYDGPGLRHVAGLRVAERRAWQAARPRRRALQPGGLAARRRVRGRR